MPLVGRVKFRKGPASLSPSIQQLSGGSRDARPAASLFFCPLVSSFASPTGSGDLATYVPSTSLKSNIFLMSSTCFFQDPSPDSPFSFAISHRGWRSCRREGEREGGTPRRCRGISCLTQTEEVGGGGKEIRKSALVFSSRGSPGGWVRACVRVSASSAPCRQPGEPDRSAGGSSYPESLFD